MTKKKVASTLVNVLDNPLMQNIIDRSLPIQPVIDKMLNHWSYDLFSRKPGTAYTDDGIFAGTDLDLACFLFALADRGAVINIPKYEGRRAKTITEGERVISNENRHGKIISIVSNKETFSFSVRILDTNVITTDSVGNFRNFMLVDLDGKWYDGWKCIEFVPTAKENDFMNNNSLWSENKVVFKNFIHPNRWISFYGQHYFITKALITRLTEEASFLKDVAKVMRDRGVRIGSSGGEKKEWPKKSIVGETKSIKVPAFEAEIDFPEYSSLWPKEDELTSSLPEYTGSTESELLKAVENRSRLFSYTLIPKLRFATRATEYAFNFYSNDGKKMPKWIENANWETGYKQKGKRKEWNRLVLSRGIALRYRKYEKSEIVSAD